METCPLVNKVSHPVNVFRLPNQTLINSQVLVIDNVMNEPNINHWQMHSALTRKRQIVKALRILNKILMTIAFFLLGYILIYGLYMSQYEYIFPEIASKEIRTFKLTAKTVNFERSIFEKRNIFQPFKGHVEVMPSKISVNFKERFHIMGIILDQAPMVAFKDLDTHEVMFISEGQTLDGVFLKEITEERILFIYEGESVIIE